MEQEGLKGWGAQQVHSATASMVSMLLVFEHYHVCSMQHLNR